MQIRVEPQPDNSVLNCLATRCQSALMEAYGEPTITELGACFHDTSGELMGGIYGTLSGSWLYIDTLWLHESQRGKGMGVQLMQCIEQAAVSCGVTRAFLGTATYQAPQFYQRLGYTTLVQWQMPRADYEQFIMVREPLTPYNLPPCPFTIAIPAPDTDTAALEHALRRYNEQFTGPQLTDLVGVVSGHGADESIVGGIAGWRMGERLLPRFLCAENAEQAAVLVTTLEAQAGDWSIAMTRAEDPTTAAYFQAAGYMMEAEIEDFPARRTTYLLLKTRA